jgi:predicted deacylase
MSFTLASNRTSLPTRALAAIAALIALLALGATVLPTTALAASAAISSAEVTPAVEPTMPPVPVPVEIGRSVRGRPIQMISLGSGPRRILVMGGIHGNEAGADVADKFIAYLLANPSVIPSGTQVDIVASANPDGRAANRRGNAHGVDLNRNFATRNWRRITTRGATAGKRRSSEPETRVLTALLTRRYVRVITLHSRGNIIDYDGPGGLSLARQVSRASGMKVMHLARFRRYTGSMGVYVPEHYRVPVITFELSSRSLKPGVLAGLVRALY